MTKKEITSLNYIALESVTRLCGSKAAKVFSKEELKTLPLINEHFNWRKACRKVYYSTIPLDLVRQSVSHYYLWKEVAESDLDDDTWIVVYENKALANESYSQLSKVIDRVEEALEKGQITTRDILLLSTYIDKKNPPRNLSMDDYLRGPTLEKSNKVAEDLIDFFFTSMRVYIITKERCKSLVKENAQPFWILADLKQYQDTLEVARLTPPLIKEDHPYLLEDGNLTHEALIYNYCYREDFGTVLKLKTNIAISALNKFFAKKDYPKKAS